MKLTCLLESIGTVKIHSIMSFRKLSYGLVLDQGIYVSNNVNGTSLVRICSCHNCKLQKNFLWSVFGSNCRFPVTNMRELSTGVKLDISVVRFCKKSRLILW